MKKTPHRKERERKRHREEILGAAEEIFADKGFHRTTVEDVAVRAEFSVGTIYNIFTGKEDLYQSLIKQRCQEISDEAHAALDQATNPLSLVEMFIRAKIDIFTKYQAFMKLYTRERMGDRFANNELWRETVAPLYEQIRDRMVEAFAKGIQEGIFDSAADPWELYIALEGITDGFLYDWLIHPEKTSFKDKYAIMLKLFFDGVRKRA